MSDEHHCRGHGRLGSRRLIVRIDSAFSGLLRPSPPGAAAAPIFVVAAGILPTCKYRIHCLVYQPTRRFTWGHDRPAAVWLSSAQFHYSCCRPRRALGEAMALAQKGSCANQSMLSEVLTGTFRLPVYRTYVRFSSTRFSRRASRRPSGSGICSRTGQSAEALRVPYPLLSLMRDHVLQTIAPQGKTSIGLQSRDAATNAALLSGLFALRQLFATT